MKDLNLMIVEDEDKLRDSLQRALSGFFAKLITAKNGDEGLKKFKKYNPDLVITDILMPIVDGLDMAKGIKEISPDTPVIVLSAYSEKERLLRAIDIGIDKYLIKPVDIDELLRIIERIKESKIGTNATIRINAHYEFDRVKKGFGARWRANRPYEKRACLRVLAHQAIRRACVARGHKTPHLDERERNGHGYTHFYQARARQGRR